MIDMKTKLNTIEIDEEKNANTLILDRSYIDYS